LRPDPFDDRVPFFGIGIEIVIIGDADAEQFVFVDVLDQHNIKAETPAADMVDGDHLLRGEDRVARPD